MALRELLQGRRMVRSFDGSTVDEAWLDECCAVALSAPTAGNCAGVRMYTLGATHVSAYLERATDDGWRQHSRRVAGLQRAGGLVLVTTRVDDYLARYGESDKADSGLSDRNAWPVPYWHTDAAMATMALIMLLEESAWRVALWGNFRHGDDVLRWVGVEGEELFATLFVGHADGLDEPSTSVARPTTPRRSRVRRLNP